MKLRRSEKNSTGKKQAHELYPKVKTFSRTYERSPIRDFPAAPDETVSPFYPDERPFPVEVPSGDSAGFNSASEDFSDPERIDLQDTLLTDESFVERPAKRHPSADSVASLSVPEGSAGSLYAEDQDVPGISAEPAGQDRSADAFESYLDSDTDARMDSFPADDPETDDVPASSLADEPSADDVQDVFPGYDVFGDESVSDKEDEIGTFSWDRPESGETTGNVAFKKKKYAVRLGKKTNLKKKLKSCPGGSLKWKSSDKKIATVSRKGVLHPKKKGKIIVRVKTGDGERAKVKIRIKSAKKKKAMPWENIAAPKKNSDNKKWSCFA